VKRPSFLLVMTDQQRADSPGFATPGRVDTPFLDALAQKGIVFENTYSASTTCVPSRSALLTGLFDQRLPRGPDGRALRDGYWNVAHGLSAVGYETALFGKMHFSPIGAHQGFDVIRSCEHLTVHAGYSPDDVDDYRRFITSQGLRDVRFLPREDMRFPYEAKLHPTSWITAEAIRFLETRDASRPFFAIVSYPGPHSPHDPPEPYASLYDGRVEPIPPDGMHVNDGLPPGFRAAFHGTPGDSFQPQRVTDLRPEDVRSEITAMRALVRHIDDSIRELMSHVSLEDTVVFFTSDHGDYGAHRGMLGKVPWIPFDDLAKVPMLCVGHGVEGGRRVTAPVQSCDIPLTFLDLASAQPPLHPFFDALSLAPVLRGQEADPERAVFCAFSMGWPMIRKGPLKYIAHGFADRVLFDLEADPGETRNVAEENLDVVTDLAIHMQLQIQRPRFELWVDPAKKDREAP
jgi:arylsulfatase A-like enzyme